MCFLKIAIQNGRSEKITSKLDVSIKTNKMLSKNVMLFNPQDWKVKFEKTCYTLAGCFQFLFQSMIEAHDNFAQEGQTEVCRLAV